jgi:peptidoglycan/xylan/chitin deacetylase (PgdA/CDA1 family)
MRLGRFISIILVLAGFFSFSVPCIDAGYDLNMRQLWPIVPASEAEVLILEYHSISKVPEGALYPDLYVSQETFNRQLQILSDAGLIGISLIDAISQMKAGNFNMGNIVFTFDDGHSDNLWAAQKMALMDYSATYFIPTFFPGKSDKTKSIYYMTWDEIRTIFSMGNEIGSHTVNHSDLAMCHESKVKFEIEQSKRDIELQLQSVDDPRPKTPMTFSIPMGSYTSAILDEIAGYGFDGCVTSNPGLMTYETLQKAPRMKILEDTDMSNILSYYIRRNLKKDGDIKKGAKGQRVKSFRTMLTRLGHPLTDSDYFDMKMEKAVMDFQKQFNLKTSGILNTTTIDRIVSDFIDLVVDK